MEERADRAWAMTEGLGNAPTAQLQWRSCAPPDTAWCPRATPDVRMLLLKTSLAESKSKLSFLQDLSTLHQGRLENYAPNMELNEVTRNSFSWFQAVSINPGMTTEAYNLNNLSPSSAAHKRSREHWVSNHGLWDPTQCETQTSARLCSGSEVR